jgi:carbon monoxide dehydrogenase subunit G
MEFRKTIQINADIDKVWDVVARDFANVGDWSSAVQSSGPNLEAAVPDGAEVGVRVCATDFGDLKETFTEYDDEAKTFTFEVSGMPSFITLARNRVEVASAGAGRTTVSLNIAMETNTIGKVMGPMFAIKLKTTLNSFLDELKDYVENGQVSKRKQKQLAKIAA